MPIRTIEQAKAWRANEDRREAAYIALGAAQAQAMHDTPIAEVGVFFDGFAAWEPGKAYAQYELFSYDGKVGYCRQAVTAQEHQPPFSTGTEAIYGVRSVPDDNGIYPYVYNMAASVGMLVQNEGIVYKCIQAIDPVLYTPDLIPAHFEKVE